MQDNENATQERINEITKEFAAGFKFIGNYLTEYGSLPSGSQISTRFDWHPPVGDFVYICHCQLGKRTRPIVYQACLAVHFVAFLKI